MCQELDSKVNVRKPKGRMNVSIQEGRSLPELEKCTTCCNHFHCPFCSSNVFKPTKLSKVRTHLESHFNRAVLHEGYTIHRCGLECRQRLHYHCVHCQSMLSRKLDFSKHLSVCKKRPFKIATTIPAPTASTILANPDQTTPAQTPAPLPAPTTSNAQLQMVAVEASGLQLVMIPQALSSSWSNASELSSICTTALQNPSSFPTPVEHSSAVIPYPIPGPKKRRKHNEDDLVKRDWGTAAKRAPQRRQNTESERFGLVVADMLEKVPLEKQNDVKLKIFKLLSESSM
ncbi:uncharacterized protein LOC115552249 isoform X2 [Gadus morhua]|uniref:uncharacterized protein LOC115552249 isoform X2 n=1 Tax=Gadus morhua TaxID=8049 RepID=UPI0011B5F102|nr:uncharacterized protein LOC115552249 isoform X2 [Gadus morhua]